VLELARQIVASEDAILSEALAGMPLAEVRKRHRYHTLQRGDRP
nr:RraA family protein [Actinomycetota bacterium]